MGRARRPLGVAALLLGWGLGCTGAAVDLSLDDEPALQPGTEPPEVTDQPPEEETGGMPPEFEPAPDRDDAPADVDWPDGVAMLADGAHVWVAEVAKPGHGIPADADPGLIVPADESWADVPAGAKVRAVTSDGTVHDAIYQGSRVIPYGCDGVETTFAFFTVDADVDTLGEVAVIRTPGPPLLAHAAEPGWRDDGYRAHVAGIPIGVKATGEQTGSLRIGKGGKGNKGGKGKADGGDTVLRVPFEKAVMDGLDADDRKLDVTRKQGDVSVPVLMGALGSSDQVVLVFRAYSWEGTHYQVYGVEHQQAPVELGSQYVYRCAF